jgi:hypothetical protein
MAKISRIRIVGAHYDQMKNKHGDTYIELSKDQEAKHTLLTLANGCGKGVMIQLISQLLLPETNWGKNNGNRVLDMFYDDKKEFHSYPIHVVLEWALDVKPKKWLVTGLCLTAEGNYSEEDDEAAKLQYFSYVAERDSTEEKYVKNLPLYTNKKVTSYEDLNEYLKSQPSIVKYSMTKMRNRRSSYYERLGEYGIYKNEWEIMKEINIDEGGVSRHFEKAQDNKSLFDELIIPAIEENLKSDYDTEEILKKIFKSNLSIVKNLPILVKRAGDFRNLIYKLEPLIEGIDLVIRRGNLLQSNHNKGMDLYKTLNALLEQRQASEKKWEVTLENDQRSFKENTYKKESLEYTRALKKVESQGLAIKAYEADYKELLVEKASVEKALEALKLNKLLIPLKNEEETIKHLNHRISALMATDSFQSINDKIKKIEGVLEKDLAGVMKHIQEKISDHYAYLNFLSHEQSKKIEEKNRLKEKLKIHQEKMSQLLYENKVFEKKKAAVQEYYSLLELSIPEQISEELSYEEKTALEQQTQLQDALDALEGKEMTLKKRIDALKFEIFQVEKAEEGIHKAYEAQYAKEKALRSDLLGVLPEEKVNVTIDEAYVKNILEKLNDHLKEKTDKLESIQEKIWLVNQDRLINTKDFWIPNREILNLKKAIESQNILVMTGTEYLNRINDSKMIDGLIEKYPLLPYGLVLEKLDQYLRLDKNLEESLLHYPVPIFVREMMHDSSQEVFHLIKNSGISFVKDKDQFKQWLNTLDEQFKVHEETKKILTNKIKLIRKTIQGFEALLGEEFSNNLYQKRERLLEKIESLNLKAEKTSENLKKTVEDQLTSREKLKGIQLSLENIYKKQKIIGDYIDGLKAFETNKKKIEGLKNQMASVEEGINKCEERILSLRSLEMEANHQLNNYRMVIDKKIEGLKEFIKGEQLTIDVSSNDFILKEKPKYTLEQLDYWSLLEERKDLQESIHSQNVRLAELKRDLVNSQKQMTVLKKELNRSYDHWQSAKMLDLTFEDLPMMISQKENLLKGKHEAIEALNKNKNILQGKYESGQENAREKSSRIEGKYGKLPQVFDEDLSRIEGDLIHEKTELKHHIHFIQEKLKSLKDMQHLLNDLKEEVSITIKIEPSKGKVIKSYLSKKDLEDLKKEIKTWQDTYKLNERKFLMRKNDLIQTKEAFAEDIKSSINEEILKEKILNTLQLFNEKSFEENKTLFTTMLNASKKELESIANDKREAESIKREWAERAAGYVVKISEALKLMIRSMYFVNESDFNFPLVKLKNEEILVKEKTPALIYTLEEYFVEAIEKLQQSDVALNEISHREIDQVISTQKIFNKAMNGVYPILLVYKMTEKNEFRYAKPAMSYYETWEGITIGEGVSTEGSGGQRLSISTFLMMMLMNYKKNQQLVKREITTVLIMDNPFSNASSPHVLDPIFEIANQLGFQIIAFAPPEIIKEEISERFPILWSMQLKMLKENGMSLLTSELIHGGRKVNENHFLK